VEAAILAEQEARRRGLAALASDRVEFDTELYGSADRRGYAHEIADEEPDQGDEDVGARGRHLAHRVKAEALEAAAAGGAGSDYDSLREYRESGGSGLANTRIADREDAVRTAAAVAIAIAVYACACACV
jgi:hypothetical protein